MNQRKKSLSAFDRGGFELLPIGDLNCSDWVFEQLPIMECFDSLITECSYWSGEGGYGDLIGDNFFGGEFAT